MALKAIPPAGAPPTTVAVATKAPAVKTASPAAPACKPMVAYDNYEGQIVAKQLCQVDFETYNNLRWAAMKPSVYATKPVIAAVAPRRVIDTKAMPPTSQQEIAAITNEIAALKAFEHTVPSSGPEREAAIALVDQMDEAIDRHTRVAAGVETEFQDVSARAEAARVEHSAAIDAVNALTPGTSAYDAADAVLTQKYNAFNELNDRKNSLQRYADKPIPDWGDND